MSSIQIRRASIDDLNTIVDFQIAMALETETKILDRETVVNGVRHLFSKSSKGWYWIAELNGKVAGCCMTLREWSDWRNASVIWLHSVFVLPEFRQSGVFKSMYRHLQALVDNNKQLCGIRLYVDKTNGKAIQTYSTLGMNGEHYQLFEWMKL